ncbi:MAG: DUF484 family protein [Rhodospirillaceae bacterium]
MENAPDTAVAADDEISSAAVADYLRRHPDFLNENPAILSLLTPPDRQSGDGVVDLQRVMIERLRGETTGLRTRERALTEAVRNNTLVQARVLKAALALNEAKSFERLIRTLTAEVPAILEVEAVALGVETTDPLPAGAGDVGVVILKPGTIDALIGPSRTVALLPDERGDRDLFGRTAARVHSVALMRLSFGMTAPAGVLAIGAGTPDAFHPGQATDLLSFLARMFEQCVCRWLTSEP